MRPKLIAALAAASLLIVSPAGSAETGAIEGVVLNASTGEPQPGVKVTLTTGTAAGEPSTDVVTTGARGHYRFDQLTTGDQNIYALDAVYEGGLFAGRALTIPDDTDEAPVIDTTLRVWETTNDPEVIVVGRNDLFIASNEDGTLGVIEAYQITNTSDRAYIGRGMGTDSEEPVPSLGFALPDRARDESIQIIDSSIDLPELLRTEYGFGITTAVPPDNFTITFSYAVPGTAASYDLSRRALYPTLNFAIFSADALDVSTNRLQPKGEVEVGGKSYIEHSTDETLESGDSIQAIALADAGTPPGLIAGMVGALLLVAALGAFPVWRSRRSRRAATEDAKGPPPRTRGSLLTAIAELDLQRERGIVDEEDWARRRAAMKAELQRMPAEVGPGDEDS